nr:MAG TPA: hypothetical protein [Caudoviricetes sp.]
MPQRGRFPLGTLRFFVSPIYRRDMIQSSNTKQKY